MKRILSAITLIAMSLILAACGGGGGGSSSSGPVTSTSSFPLKSAYTTLIANGLSKTFTISGDCGGSGTKTAAAATTSATFEGVTGFSAVGTITTSSAAPCAASSATSFTAYYDTNYIPLGLNSVGVNYGVYLTAPIIPASVIVGNTGITGTETLYTDSTKTVGNGRVDGSYVIEPDTANTAIVNIIGKLYNATPTLIATEQDRFRIATTGALVPISTDIQYATISTLHLRFTYQ
jgi:hypothetical protein